MIRREGKASGMDLELELRAIANRAGLSGDIFSGEGELLDAALDQERRSLLFDILSRVRERKPGHIDLGYCYQALFPESNPWAVPPTTYFEWNN